MSLKEALALPKHPLLPLGGYVTNKEGSVTGFILDMDSIEWRRVRKKLETMRKMIRCRPPACRLQSE